MNDVRQGRCAARAIAVAVLGRDPGPMAAVDSSSHDVYVSPDVVVKIIDAARHSRLDREIALASHLPAAGLAITEVPRYERARIHGTPGRAEWPQLGHAEIRARWRPRPGW